MVRPATTAKADDDGGVEDTRPIYSGVAKETMYPDMDKMYSTDEDDEDPITQVYDDDDINASSDDDDSEDYSEDDDDFAFDDRGPDKTAKEALRRSRQTQEAVLEMKDTMDAFMSTMQTGGLNTVTGDNIPEMSFSAEDTALINDAMQTNPAEAMRIMGNNMMRQASKYARDTVSGGIKADTARRDAELGTARDFPQLKNPTHPFSRKVRERYRELKKTYQDRGIDTNSMPELIRYAANEVATENPKLVRTQGDTSRLRENSRQRQANRASDQGRSRGQGGRKDDLPELTKNDMIRAEKMGINIDDPKELKALRMRRRSYEARRRG